MEIREFIRPVSKYFGSVLPIKKLISATNQKVIFPFYHIVTDDAPMHVKHRYGIKSTKSFESDLDYLLTYFEPLDVDGLMSYKINGSVKKSSFFLSFDDGLSQFYDVVAPILLRKGVPAACFLNSDFVDNKDLFYRYKASLLAEYLKSDSALVKKLDPSFSNGRSVDQMNADILNTSYLSRHILDTLAMSVGLNYSDYLRENTPYMSSIQIKSLIEKGFYFGSHSIDHPMYSTISMEEQIRQTETSMSWVENTFAQKFRMFAFPFSDFGVSNEYFDYFNSEKLDISFGTAGLKNDVYANHFQRIPMEVPNVNAETIIKTEYIYYGLKSLMGKNTIKRND